MTDLVDMVRELVDRHIHRERYDTTRGQTRVTQHHVTTNPPLLDQLAYEVQQAGNGGQGLTTGYMSRPTARIDVLDTLIRIDYEARDLLASLGGETNVETKTLVRRLGALDPSAERCHRTNPQRDDKGNVICCDSHRIHAAIRNWWTWCRVVTGWDLPAWSPDNTCPACGKRGALRIKYPLGSCIEDNCRTTWDEATIGILVEHIRAENGDEAA